MIIQTQIFLDAKKILQYIFAKEEVSTLVDCKSAEVQLVTNDFEVYCALGSLIPSDNVDVKRLAKLFEVADVLPFRQSGNPKPILTFNKVEELRATLT